MRPDPDRIGELRKIEAEALGEGACERLEIGRPGPVAVPAGLAMEGEQPGPAIRPLEAARIGPVEIGELP